MPFQGEPVQYFVVQYMHVYANWPNKAWKYCDLEIKFRGLLDIWFRDELVGIHGVSDNRRQWGIVYSWDVHQSP